MWWGGGGGEAGHVCGCDWTANWMCLRVVLCAAPCLEPGPCPPPLHRY